MECHEVQNIIYENTIGDYDASVSEHLEHCEECQRELRKIQRLENLFVRTDQSVTKTVQTTFFGHFTAIAAGFCIFMLLVYGPYYDNQPVTIQDKNDTYAAGYGEQLLLITEKLLKDNEPQLVFNYDYYDRDLEQDFSSIMEQIYIAHTYSEYERLFSEYEKGNF